MHKVLASSHIKNQAVLILSWKIIPTPVSSDKTKPSTYSKANFKNPEGNPVFSA